MLLRRGTAAPGSPPRRCRRLPEHDGALGKDVMRWTHVLDEYFRHRAAQALFSGAVLITQGATRLYARAYGYASRPWRVPNTLDTPLATAPADDPLATGAP